MNRIFGLKYKYPQSFINDLEKWLGVKFTKVEFKCISKDEISVHPLPPPSNQIFYIERKYEK